MFRRLMIGVALMAATTVSAQTATVGPDTIPGATREQKLRLFNAKLKEADVNDDGRLTSEEWIAAGGKKAGFDALDYNKDNVLTYQELRSNARKLKAYDDFVAAPPH